MKPPTQTPSRPGAAPASGLSLGDIYYILFRHKWKIILIFLAGLLGAGGLYLAKPPMYQSKPKFSSASFWRAKTPWRPMTMPAQSPMPRRQHHQFEIEILTSFDLAGLVADVVGRKKSPPK